MFDDYNRLQMSNTWPGGKRHAMTQDEHERWNARNYPGTLQLCCVCDHPTWRCEEDAIYIEPIVPNGSCCGPSVMRRVLQRTRPWQRAGTGG